MNPYIKNYGTCKYRKKAITRHPCNTCGQRQWWGTGNVFNTRWRPSLITRVKRFWDKFRDDQEFIRLKLAVVMILMIVGMTLDSWR